LVLDEISLINSWMFSFIDKKATHITTTISLETWMFW
jgi:hypothetical protein